MAVGTNASRFGCGSGLVRADWDGGHRCILADREPGYDQRANCPVCSISAAVARGGRGPSVTPHCCLVEERELSSDAPVLVRLEQA